MEMIIIIDGKKIKVKPIRYRNFEQYNYCRCEFFGFAK